MSDIKFGVFLPFYSFKEEVESVLLFAQLKKVVLECERLGYDSVWLDDHLMYDKMPILESWTTLSALAPMTTRVRLGTMVTSAGFRNPALLAKMAATVDVISEGRLELGMGAGVQREEHLAYGYTFPEARVRIERLKEAIEIVERLWMLESASYSGKYFHIEGADCHPKPLQKPHPPITVGGCGEKFLLKVTAQYADRVDFGYLPSIEIYEKKSRILENYYSGLGRDSNIEKSCWPAGQIILSQNSAEIEEKIERSKPKNVSIEDFKRSSLVGTPEDCLEVLRVYIDLGATYFMLYFGDLPDLGSLRLFSEAIFPKLG